MEGRQRAYKNEGQDTDCDSLSAKFCCCDVADVPSRGRHHFVRHTEGSGSAGPGRRRITPPLLTSPLCSQLSNLPFLRSSVHLAVQLIIVGSDDSYTIQIFRGTIHPKPIIPEPLVLSQQLHKQEIHIALYKYGKHSYALSSQTILDLAYVYIFCDVRGARWKIYPNTASYPERHPIYARELARFGSEEFPVWLSTQPLGIWVMLSNSKKACHEYGMQPQQFFGAARFEDRRKGLASSNF
ncbi:hypothetical protein CC78DRAFT_575546 [Lojkania enalia]|uniref:Uncharacterized protein n=1 Tax=Lojkania enalia TaxID=147567 RepID=A0A9P4N9B2_9PLEO|nr:hypothetical protein CC78DRAFT_575546 [Didymosphaeria enalia]